MAKGSSACFPILFSNHLLSAFCPPSWQKAPRKAQSQRVLQPLWFSTAQQQPRAMASAFALQLKLWPPQSSLRWPAKGQNWACPYSRMWSWPHSLSLRADDASPGGEVPSQSSPAREPREMSSYPLPSALDTAIWGGNCVLWVMVRCGAFLTWSFTLTPVLGASQPQSHIDHTPRGKFLMYPQPKAFPDGPNNHPCPCTCTCLF